LVVVVTEIKIGTDAIRAALYARVRKVNTAGMARDLGIPSSTLDAFAAGQIMLPADTLKLLAAELFHGHAELDVELNLLRSTNRQAAKSIGPGPPPIEAMIELPTYDCDPIAHAPRPHEPTAPVTKMKRAGWAE
jgi:hypothetical protein